MVLIQDIIDSIKNQIVTEYPEFQELYFSNEIETNKFSDSTKKFSVLPKTATDFTGAMKFSTIDHVFEISLTNSFKVNNLDDIDKTTKSIELQQICKDLYLKWVANRLNNNNVIIVKELSITEPEFLEEDQVVINRFTVTIQYRDIAC